MDDQLSVFRDDLIFDHSEYAYPCRLLCVSGARTFEDPTSSYYGFVAKGECELTAREFKGVLKKGMYFALPGGFSVLPKGDLVVFQRWGYRALTAFGGPIEKDGRLSYVDSSRATILIPPARLGDPVLNHLVFPPNIRQTVHLHPTTRLGLVISGSGSFVTTQTKPLECGMVFALDPFKVHSFHSGPNGLQVIAFHPDSDVGPTDELHPMKSRTYLQV